jgi:ribosome biogenesis GTPase A
MSGKSKSGYSRHTLFILKSNNQSSDGGKMEIMSSRSRKFRDELRKLISDQENLAKEIAPDKDSIIEDLKGQKQLLDRHHVQFFVAGVVNSGKSSFINALLGSEICKVDEIPCTSEIQEIVYSDKDFKRRGDGGWEIGYPNKFLKDLALLIRQECRQSTWEGIRK